MRDFHDPYLLACAGMTVNTHEVHPEPVELLPVAAGAAAAGFLAAGAAERSIACWCSLAGGSRATSTSPRSTIPGSKIISVQRRRSPLKDRPDFLSIDATFLVWRVSMRVSWLS